MMNYQKRVYGVIALLIFGLVVTILVASLALEKRDASVYPGNLHAGPVYLGNLTRTEALHKLEDTSESLEVTCIVTHGNYPLKLRDIGVQLNAEATLNMINSSMEGWSLFDHSIHRGKKQMVVPVWEYDFDKLLQSLDNLALSSKREAVDARLMLHGDQLLYYPEQEGSQIDAQQAVSIMTELLNEGQFKVILPEKSITPTLTSVKTSRVQELLSVQAVPISGDYPEENSTGWAVPGKVILPGESIYINMFIDASTENAEDVVALWHEALARSAFDTGLIYKIDDMQMYNPSDEPAALFITRENNLWLIRIYGQQNETGKKTTLSRTYAPFLTSKTGKENQGNHQKLYRHEFVDSKLQTTELLKAALSADNAPSTDNNNLDHENTIYK